MQDKKSASILLWLVSVGFFLQTLDATIVNTALPAMARELGESPLRMQSVVVAYSLTMAMLIPASGWVCDRFGIRRIYCAAIVVFALGSALCAFSQNLSQLVASRVLQGLGGALLLPVGRLAILRSFPREEFLRALSFVAIPGLIGPLLGPTMGGWLVEYASWHWVFLINLPVALVGLAFSLRFMPEGRMESVGRFDLSGYLLLAVGMVTISLSLEGMSELGLPQVAAVVLLVFGLASVAAYWLHALRVPQPLFTPRLFTIATLRIGLLGNLFARLGSSCMPFLLPVFLQVSMGFSPSQAGMTMLPIAIAGMVAKPMVTRLIRRVGYRNVLVGNTALVGLMMMTFALSTAGQPLWLRLLQLGCFGLVNSVQFTAMNTITLKDLEGPLTSSGNSLLSMTQMLAMSLGVAAAGAVLAAYSGHFGEAADAVVMAFHATFVTMGAMTLASTWIFWQLSPEIRNPEARSPAEAKIAD